MRKLLFKEKWYASHKSSCFRIFYLHADMLFIVNFMYVSEADTIGKIPDLMLPFCFLLFCNFTGPECLYLETPCNNH